VNELIKNVILYAFDIFPNEECQGEEYSKIDLLIERKNDNPLHSTKSKSLEEAEDDEGDDDDEAVEIPLNAVALYDFKARSARELNLLKGQRLTLLTRVSTDWWKGFHKISDPCTSSQQQQKGLIPHKYIEIVKDQSPQLKEEPIPSTSSSNSTQNNTEMKFTPDLVLDLPNQQSPSPTGVSSEEEEGDEESSEESESEITVVTGAEVFAKQNQCTLKKISSLPLQTRSVCGGRDEAFSLPLQTRSVCGDREEAVVVGLSGQVKGGSPFVIPAAGEERRVGGGQQQKPKIMAKPSLPKTEEDHNNEKTENNEKNGD